MSTQKRVFLLGMGCQKGGTSWLHAQLSQSPCFEPDFSKEYHVFNRVVKTAEKTEHQGGAREFHADAITQSLENSDYSNETQHSIKTHFRSNLDSYYHYFESLLSESISTTATGDFTPAYAGLTVEQLSSIKSEFKRRGIDTKIIFLLREPLERIWSQVRMRRRNQLENNPSVSIIQTEQESLLERYKEPAVELRTRYENTIENIESVFDENDVLYALYEDLFTDATKKRIESFIGLELPQYKSAEKVNASPKSAINIDDDVKRLIVNHYKNTYMYCNAKFDIESKWSSFKFLNV